MQKRTTITLESGESDFAYFGSQIMAPCIKAIVLVLFCMCVLIFFNATLILGFSYAINNTTHNMSSGCLRCEPEPCATRLVFYGQTSVVTLLVWSLLLFFNEAIVGALITAFAIVTLRYFNRRYDEYRLTILNGFPTVALESSDEYEEEMLTL